MIGGPFRQEPLWNFYDSLKNEFVVWSAKINKEDRFVYIIHKGDNKIDIINLIGHRVATIPYSDTVKTPYAPQKSVLDDPAPKVDKNGNLIKQPKNKHK